ncbi:MAG TPA: bifunctional precorrin-2 dehydrogenase/sirohydrochlorin ferrochelatase [Acidimicrobiales bacterium]|nr:bifunctional precorrin-2 dehydrogenase/sirohydrochlorin ferrochelatase [Acidimicrobiales bacterium]
MAVDPAPSPVAPSPAVMYPVALDMAGRPCLVVGGGPVAAGKVAGLVRAGAAVTVVAAAVGTALEALVAEGDGAAPGSEQGSVTVHRRPYRAGEAAGYRLVVAATGTPEVDGAVAADAEAAGVWVNSVDDPEHSTFHLPSVHRDGPVVVAVSTGGASPALASWLRRRAGRELGPDLGTVATLLEDARRRLQAAGRPTGSVDWPALLDGPLLQLVRDGRTDEARRLIAEATGLPA